MGGRTDYEAGECGRYGDTDYRRIPRNVSEPSNYTSRMNGRLQAAGRGEESKE